MPISHKVFSHFQLWEAEVGNESLKFASNKRELLGQTELSRLANTNSQRKKHEYILSRYLLRYSLSQWHGYSLDYWQIIENHHAAPSVVNLPAPIYFSLSHSKGRIQIALSPHVIGIDIEEIKPRNNILEMAQASLHISEYLTFSTYNRTQQIAYFYQLWCAKEAYYKTLKTSAQQALIFAKLDVMFKLDGPDYLYFDLGNEHFANCIVVQV